MNEYVVMRFATAATPIVDLRRGSVDGIKRKRVDGVGFFTNRAVDFLSHAG